MGGSEDVLLLLCGACLVPHHPVKDADVTRHHVVFVLHLYLMFTTIDF